jgi:ABC-type branched-subunit amino acid transport system substrate-binding protein
MDFSASLSEIKALNPDMFFFWCSGFTETFVSTRQLMELNWRAKLCYNLDGPLSPDWPKTFGKFGDGWMACGITYDEKLPDPGAAEFNDKLQKKFGISRCGCWDPNTYASLQLIKGAIENAGSIERDKIREGLLALRDYPTIIGPVTFGNKTTILGNYVTQVKLSPSGFAYQIINGVKEIVWPSAVKTKDFIYPLPPLG